MRRGRFFWLMVFQYAAGIADTLTGLLLIFAPRWTLRLMGLTVVPAPAVFASFIGVFVFCVGFTYLWAGAAWAPTLASRERWAMQWRLTALFRTCVAIFVAIEIAAGRLEPAWATVAISDAALAAVQWTGLRRGWLRVAR